MLSPPVPPMLAKLARTLPLGDQWRYEPKWDGFRCLVFRDGDEVDLRSRHDRPLARYFPELVEAFLRVAEPRFVVDGEILVTAREGFDFSALMSRLHPAASRVARLRIETPATFVAFDVLAVGDEGVMLEPYVTRRRDLDALVGGEPAPLCVTPCTDDAGVADRWLDEQVGSAIDGVIAKLATASYEPGRRAMVKVKRERTADCVVAGFRLFEGDRKGVSSLLLGVYDERSVLRHVGAVASFTASKRVELLNDLRPLVVPLAGHPWEHGFGLGPNPMGRLLGAAGRWTPDLEPDWIPIRPDLVCEVAYDRMEHDRFRHAARFRRWRPDRDPVSCTFEQFERT